MSYEKPRTRPGMILCWVRWGRDGRVIEERYRAIDRHEPAVQKAGPAEARPIRRGALASEQGRLF